MDKDDTCQKCNEVKRTRETLAKEILTDTVDKFMTSIKWSSFKTHYKCIYDKDKIGLRGLYQQLMKDIRSRIIDEVYGTLLNDTFFKTINLLDDIESKVKDNDPSCTENDQKANTWRPSRVPERDLEPHRIAIKMTEKRNLEKLLNQLKRENEALRQDNCNDRMKVCEYEQQMQMSADKFNKIVESCKFIPLH